MSSITWSNSVPSQATSASSVDDLMRSLVTSVAVGLGEVMYWPGSAAAAGASEGSTGMMVPGSGRLSRASERANIAYGDGYLSVSTKRNVVVHVGSTRSSEVVAHPMGYEMYAITASPSYGTRMGMMFSGSTTTDVAASVVTVIFPSLFSAPDADINVQLHSSRSDVICTVTSASSASFLSVCSQIGGTGASHTLTWSAMGPIVS